MKSMTPANTDKQNRIIQELAPLDVGGWHAILGLKQDFKCAYCDRDYIASYDAFRSVEFDHVIPLSRGGEDGLENIVTCCRTCNQIKLSYLPIGNSKEERVADARHYVKDRRLQKDSEVAKIRLLVRGN
jgi:5-methylcytosine-specific restriction endonuclease McrA